MASKGKGTMARLGAFDRLLTLWIFLAMVTGVGIGAAFPGVSVALDSMSVGTTNIPIAVGLIPIHVLACSAQYSKMPEVFRDKRLLALSLLLNWVICPILMSALALIFLNDAPAYMSGASSPIGLARCIAMVLVWNELAGGDNNYAAGLVAVNAIFQVVLYGPMAWFFLAVAAPAFGAAGTVVDVSVWEIAQSVLVPISASRSWRELSRAGFSCGPEVRITLKRGWFRKYRRSRPSPCCSPSSSCSR